MFEKLALVWFNSNIMNRNKKNEQLFSTDPTLKKIL